MPPTSTRTGWCAARPSARACCKPRPATRWRASRSTCSTTSDQDRPVAWDRIEWLYAQRPVPTTDVYLDLVGRELFELCQSFPPAPDEIAFIDDGARARFAPLLAQMHAPAV